MKLQILEFANHYQLNATLLSKINVRCLFMLSAIEPVDERISLRNELDKANSN